MSYSVDENLYLISVESQVSIDYCLVHCDSKVDVLDVERNLAILSLTKTVLSVLFYCWLLHEAIFFQLLHSPHDSRLPERHRRRTE